MSWSWSKLGPHTSGMRRTSEHSSLPNLEISLEKKLHIIRFSRVEVNKSSFQLMANLNMQAHNTHLMTKTRSQENSNKEKMGNVAVSLRNTYHQKVKKQQDMLVFE